MSIEQSNIIREENFNENISLKELILQFKSWIKFLKSKWKLLLLISFFGGLIGLLFSWNEKPIYKAVLTFAMEEDKGSGGMSGAAGLASSFGIDLGGASGGAFAATNLSELMKSRLIIEKVLLNPIEYNNEIISIAELYIKINDLRKSWQEKKELREIKFLPNSNRNTFTLKQDSILKVIYTKLVDKEHLTIMQKDKKVSILSIEVKNESEIFSKIFCEQIARITSDYYIETKSKKAKMNVDVLQIQVDSVKKELNYSINGVANEIDNVYNLNPAFNIKGANSKKRQFDVQANTAILTNLLVQLELAKITLRKETPLIQFIDTPILPLEKSKFGKLKSLILGGFVAFFLTIFYIEISKLYSKIMK